MSRFVGTAGPQLDQLQKYLGRRGTLEDTSHKNSDAQDAIFPPSTIDSVESHTSVLSASPEESIGFIPNTCSRDSDAGSSNLTATDRIANDWNYPAVATYKQEQEPLLRKRQKRKATRMTPGASSGSKASSFKLDTMSGVFIPVVLSIWGVLVFLRFGFIIGQTGVLGTLLLLSIGYFITTTTTLSISAISTNGTVRSGGPYFMISRSLGPEFGGSIGLIFYIGTVMGGAMNVFGFVEPLMANFGSTNGTLLRLLPEGKWYNFMYGSIMLLFCTSICLLGSKLFAKASKLLACILAFSTLSIFVSFAFRPAFVDEALSVYYSGPSFETLRANLWPNFTSDAVGSAPGFAKESFRSVFGVLFPTCTGILAGASMSGDLRNPSRSIPKGTLSAVGATFVTYAMVVLLLGSAVARTTFYADLSVLQDIALFPPFVAAGVLSTATFSTLGAIIGASKILQAIAKDNLIPALSPFSKGTKKDNEPVVAVIFTYCLCQVLLLAGDINAIAPFVAMCSLLTFGVINLACFLLKAGAAPNFRPTFQYFKATTALVGGIACFIVMFVVDAYAAAVATAIMASIFGAIHYVSPPKSWGDVTQSLIYHQVRKYLLRLDSRKEHVKFWRPQILLLVNNPRTSYGLIVFCNALKKGALYVLGHIIKGEFTSQVAELRRQQASWLRYVDVVNIKAFTSVTIAETEKLGARNLILGSGLGGMRPNIIVMGSFDLDGYNSRKSTPASNGTLPNNPSTDGDSSVTIDLHGSLPTDGIKVESPIGILDYMSIIEDSLHLDKAVGIAHGFSSLEFPFDAKVSKKEKKKFIDLWPIQMTLPGGGANFDTYTMVLQMGCVLQMVKQWKRGHQLRVVVFVEKEADAEEEKRRVQELLDTLRIRAELVVLWLEGEIESYGELLKAEVDKMAHDLVPVAVNEAPEEFQPEEWSKEDTSLPSIDELGPSRISFAGFSAEESSGSISYRRPRSSTNRSNTLPFEPSSDTSHAQKPFPVKRIARRSATMYPVRTDSLAISSNIRINLPLPKPEVLLESDWSSDEDEVEESDDDESNVPESEDVDEENSSLPSSSNRTADTTLGSSYGTMLPSSSNGLHSKGSTNPLSSSSSSPTLALQDPSTSDFNILPSTAQNKIINRLIQRHSCKANGTAMVFTALPAPEPGASENVLKAEKWLNDLDALIGGLDVPSMCIHGKGMTVTTNL